MTSKKSKRIMDEKDKEEIKVSDFVEKDIETGKTSFKIPVKDEETVAQAIKSLAGIFTAFTNT